MILAALVATVVASGGGPNGGAVHSIASSVPAHRVSARSSDENSICTDGTTLHADLWGHAGMERITQRGRQFHILDHRGRFYTAIEVDALPVPILWELDGTRRGRSILPQVEPHCGSLNLLVADVDSDRKADIVVPFPKNAGAGFRIYSGRGRLKMERGITPDVGSFLTAFPADYRDGILYLLAHSHDPHAPRGVVAYDLRIDRQAWFFHLPTDPLALRKTDAGYLISHATSAQGVYQYIGRERRFAAGYDGTLRIYEIGFDGALLNAARILDGDLPIRGVAELSVDPGRLDVVRVRLNNTQLLVRRTDGRVVSRE
ncbi:MAG: hypothetical protein MI724_12720 [Spirochaetales bacterium]|nr:hypothetical protein [Spirochaetales bacterium]